MKNILIVDDDRDLVSMFQMRLDSEGFKTEVAYDGKEALESIQKKAPDLIVMDALMPGLDGLATLKQIRQMTDKKIPVMIITGKALMIEQAFRLEGAEDFMMKPVDGADLVKRIRQLEARHKQHLAGSG